MRATPISFWKTHHPVEYRVSQANRRRTSPVEIPVSKINKIVVVAPANASTSNTLSASAATLIQ